MVVTLTMAPIFGQVHAASPSPVLEASLHPDYVQVSIGLHVYQNLTGLRSTFSFPYGNSALDGDNSTLLESYLQTSIQSKAPSATVTDLTLLLASTPVNNATLSQWLNLSLQFRVGGVHTFQNGLDHFDMSWKSFNVPQNVTVGQFEANNIGQMYLYNAAVEIATIERSSTTSLITYGNIVNYFRVTTPNLASRTARINLLNFTQLLPSLDKWQQTYDYSSNSVTWSFDLNQILGLMITTTSNEPQATPTTNGAIYTIQAAVSAPVGSWAQGNTVNAVFNNNSEALMAFIIGTGITVLAVSLLVERRVLKRVKRKSRR